MPSILFNR